MAEMEAPPAEKQETFEHPKDLTYRKDMFYTKSANTSVLLQGGKTLRFNKDILRHTVQSDVLEQMFFGPLKDDETTEITDVDYDTFKLFLDCIMGYEQYTFDNALKIFPVVRKYLIDQATEECVAVLKPSEMDERVCHVLNMASLYTCEKLVKDILAFISTYNSSKFLEDERYCHLLGPDSIKEVMFELPMDSYLLEKIVKWGENFIKNNKQFGNSVQELFEKADLLKYFKLEYFETTGALYGFCLTEIGKKIFPPEKVLMYLQKSGNLTHRNSTWKKMEKDKSITEEIHFLVDYAYNIDAFIKIEGNKVAFYDAPESEKLIDCHINIILENSSESTLLTHDYPSLVKHSKSRIYFTHAFSYNPDDTYPIPDSPSPALFPIKLKVKLTWTFPRDCRVLLTNMPGDEVDSNMYFAKNFAFSGFIAYKINAN